MIGRFALGEIVPLAVWTRNSSDTPTLPVRSPVAAVYSGTALVLTQSLPISDRYGVTGFFSYGLHLDARFTTGPHSVIIHYVIGSSSYLESQDFEVVAGGNALGAGIASYYFSIPQANVVLLQTDAGKLLRRRNPRVE